MHPYGVNIGRRLTGMVERVQLRFMSITIRPKTLAERQDELRGASMVTLVQVEARELHWRSAPRPLSEEQRRMIRDDVRSLRRILELYNPGPLAVLEHPIVGEDAESLLTKLDVHVALTRSVFANGDETKEGLSLPLHLNSMRLRILAFGLLALCVAMLVWPDSSGIYWNWGSGFSLSTLVALAGAWTSAVWLWNDKATKFCKELWTEVWPDKR